MVRSSKFVHSLFFNFFVQFSPIEFNPLQFSPIFWGRTRRNSENFAALGGLVKMRNYLELSWKSTSCVSSTAIGPRTKPLAVFNHKPLTTRLCRGFRRRQGYDGQASGQADPQPLPFQRTGACAPHIFNASMFRWEFSTEYSLFFHKEVLKTANCCGSNRSKRSQRGPEA